MVCAHMVCACDFVCVYACVSMCWRMCVCVCLDMLEYPPVTMDDMNAMMTPSTAATRIDEAPEYR